MEMDYLNLENRKKKDIDIEMLDYEYVEKCNDIDLLKGILSLLLSGKEGKYPLLEKKTKDKILNLLPEKERKKIILMEKGPSVNEIQDATIDLSKWTNEIINLNENITNQTSFSNHKDNINNKYIAPVRGINKNERNNKKDNNNNNRIESMSLIERKLCALKEKQKGNEIFKTGEDLNDAILYYTKSLLYDNTNPIVYSNRALVYLKLKYFEKAEKDCTNAIELDPNYIKAWSRRGMIRYRRGKYKEAIDDFKKVLEFEPFNNEIKKLVIKTQEKRKEVDGERYIHNNNNNNDNTLLNNSNHKNNQENVILNIDNKNNLKKKPLIEKINHKKMNFNNKNNKEFTRFEIIEE